MISAKELNPHSYPLTPEQVVNQDKLLKSINIVRKAWGKVMNITSGVRSMTDQMRINPSAPKSKHLLGAACDISDDGSLYEWLHNDGAKYMEEADLYGEIGTKGWCHLQILKFGSYKEGGSRWFKP